MPTIGSFLLTVELLCLQLFWGSFCLQWKLVMEALLAYNRRSFWLAIAMGAFLLTNEALLAPQRTISREVPTGSRTPSP